MTDRRLHTFLLLLATLLVMAAGVACVEPIDITTPEVTEEVELNFEIVLPSATLSTKAEPIPTSAALAEGAINDLWIWAFPSGSDDLDAVAFLHPTLPLPADGHVTFKLRSAVANGYDKLDFYVLANGASAGFTATEKPNRGALKNASISGDTATGFGSEKVETVPTDGLPMACAIENLDIRFLRYGFTNAQKTAIAGRTSANPQGVFDNDDLVEVGLTAAQREFIWQQLFRGATGTWTDLKTALFPEPQLPLVRAVSKIRFVFAKSANMTATTTEITSIELVNEKTPKTETAEAEYEYMLPKATWLFPRSTTSYDDWDAFKWEGAPLIGTIASVDSPLRLRFDKTNLSLANYEKFLDEEIAAGYATEKVLYLRESDKAHIQAKITYTLGDESGKVAYIDLPGNFYRNTWWTVYAYFVKFELEYQVTVRNTWDVYGANGAPGAISYGGGV